MRSIASALAAAAAALAVACSSDPPKSRAATEAGAPITKGDAHFVVDFRTSAGPVGRLLGWNLGRGTYYAPEGDAAHPEWRTPERIAAIARLSEVRAADGPAPYVRFSGLQIDGSFGADGYHFWDFVKPGRTPTATDNVSVPEFAAIADEMRGELTVTVNFGSGTADEAARYVTYLNGSNEAAPEVRARVDSGKADPYGVSVIELGNEVYGFWNTGNTATGKYSYANPGAANGGDPAWAGKPAANAADYAHRALEYVGAIRAVSPNVTFRVPLTQSSLDAWGGLDAAIDGLRPLLTEPAVDAVVVHLYEADDGTTLGVTDLNAPEWVVAASELFRPRLHELRTKLDSLERATPLGIAITEYNVADGFSHGKYLLGNTAAVGLGIADLLALFAEEKVDHACQHLALSFEASTDLLVEDWYNPFRATDGGLVEMPSYVVTRLFSDHLLPELAELTTELSDTHTLTVGSESHDYASVHAVAFRNSVGTEGTVFLVNRDLERTLRVTLDVGAGFRAKSARIWAPSAVDVDATRGVDSAVLPAREAGALVEIVMPPHSVAALREAR